MRHSNELRLVCKELRETVMDIPWMDAESKIKGSLRARRAAFPAARAVNVSNRADLVDTVFVHICGRVRAFRGKAPTRLHTLNTMRCGSVAEAAFGHLRGIQSLNMSYCNQVTITDTAFVHLRGIHTLDMSGCNQATITDVDFVHLRGIHSLNMYGFNQETITDVDIANLVGIAHLITIRCRREIRVFAAELLGDEYESEDEDDVDED